MRKRAISAALCGVFMMSSISACTSPGKRTAIGAGAGAGGGAVIGAIIGGKKGAAIGAAVGAASGAAVGNYLDKQAKELEKVAETKRTRDGILVKLQNDLTFAVDSSEVRPESVSDIEKLGEILAKYPEDRIAVEGHTDSTGPSEYNGQLSLDRARAVSQILLSKGVKSEQIRALGYGESQPVASNESNRGRSQNRRVQLKIDIPKTEQASVESKQGSRG